MSESIAKYIASARWDEIDPYKPRVQSPAEIEHWKQTREKKPILPELSFRSANNYLLDRAEHFLSMRNKVFTVDQYNKEVLVKLILYFSRDPRFDGDLNKGLLLRGEPGTGKSFPLLCFTGLNSPVSCEQSQQKSMSELDDLYSEKGMEGINPYKTGVAIFDDVNKDIESCYMGNKIKLTRHLLETRYNLYIRTGTVTHVTTNLMNGDRIQTEFEYYIRSRFREMFNTITVKGPDRR